MIGLVALLVVCALVAAIVSLASGRVPLAVAVILTDLAILLTVWPGGK